MPIDLSKPRYAAPCNGCGLCCKLELCHIAEQAFEELGFMDEKPPCSFLVESEGRYWCKVVQTEAAHLEKLPSADPRIAKSLMIGWGCTMPDEDAEAA